MTTRRTTVRVCPHEADVRDCGTCVAAAHDRAYAEAVARLVVCPRDTASREAAEEDRDRAMAAAFGHRVLREHGIAPPVWPTGRSPRCGFCGKHPDEDRCINTRCPGRRVRCQVPEVRT